MKKLILLQVMFLMLGTSLNYAQPPKPVRPGVVIAKDTCDLKCKEILIQDQKKLIAAKDTEIADLQDSITQAQAKLDSLYNVVKLSLHKPEAGSKPIAWFDYAIGILVVIFLFMLKWFGFLKNINIPIVQSFVGEMEKFAKKWTYIFGTVSGILFSILQAHILTGYTLNIANNLFVICCAFTAAIPIFNSKKTK